MQAPTAPRPVHVPGSLDRTQPIPVVRAVVRPARRGLTTSMLIGAVVATALIATGTVAFVLGTRTATASPTIATPPVSVIAPAAAPAPAAPGPALVDRDGRPVDPEIAAVVTRMYDALEAGDLETVRRAYSATGSDDWHTSSPHLSSAAERSGVLAALRERPAPHDGYIYSVDGYTVQFGQGVSIAPPGLLTIDGPWVEEDEEDQVTVSDNAAADDPQPERDVVEEDDTVRTSGCAETAREVTTEGLPCQDIETGRGVERDGTVGVHGLRPCPAGTSIPSDPDEPTRNARTGEMCAVY